MRHRRLASVITLAVLALPAPGLGAFGVSPLRLFTPGSPNAGSSPETGSIALNARGDAVAGELTRAAGATLATPTVRSRTGLRGGWSGSVRLASPTRDTTPPIVRINATGGAVAVFERGGRYVASRRRAGVWQRVRAVGANSSPTGDVTAVALRNDGRARFVHVLPEGACDPGAGDCTWIAVVYDQPGPGAIWVRDPDTLRFGPTSDPVVSLSRRGDILIAWTGPGASAPVTVSRRLASETVFETPTVVSPNGVRGAAFADIGDGGDAAVGWVLPDGPGPATGTFTGAIQVATRRVASPIWANAETVVQPGSQNPDGTLAIDGAGNVLVAWTTFGDGPGATDALRAATRRAATASWTPSPVLGSASIGDGESLRNPRAFIESGRAFVYAVRQLGGGINQPRVSVGGLGGGWSTRSIAGSADPAARARDSVDYLVASAPGGRLLLAGDGLQVRNVDSAATPAAAAATRLSVRVSGRRATLAFRLNVAARVWVERAGGTGFRTVGEYRPVTLRAGATSFALGRLAPGRYRVRVGACNARRGCTVSKAVVFRIR